MCVCIYIYEERERQRERERRRELKKLFGPPSHLGSGFSMPSTSVVGLMASKLVLEDDVAGFEALQLEEARFNFWGARLMRFRFESKTRNPKP